MTHPRGGMKLFIGGHQFGQLRHLQELLVHILLVFLLVHFHQGLILKIQSDPFQDQLVPPLLRRSPKHQSSLKPALHGPAVDQFPV